MFPLRLVYFSGRVRGADPTMCAAQSPGRGARGAIALISVRLGKDYVGYVGSILC